MRPGLLADWPRPRTAPQRRERVSRFVLVGPKGGGRCVEAIPNAALTVVSLAGIHLNDLH